MYLKSLNKLFKSIGFRLSIWYSSFFILGSVILLMAAYFFLLSTITEQDREGVKSELNELASEYDSGGMKHLNQEVEEDYQFRKKNPFFIRIAESSNRTLKIFSSHLWEEFDVALTEKFAQDNAESWISLPAIDEDYVLELFSKRLKDGRWLQVGISSEERQKIIGQFREIFTLIMFPLIFLGFSGGAILSTRTLKPIRNIIQTVQSIEIGRMVARVQRTGTGDELDELARLFNEMLDKISTLVTGMKESLDNVAHDLRTPMTRLRNVSEVALYKEDQNVDLYKEALEESIEESDRILKMLNTLMDISEAETGGLTLNREFVDISLLVGRVIDMYQYVAEEKKINLNQKTSNELFAVVDPDRLSQALANIIDNAIKYSSNEGQIDIEIYQSKGNLVNQIKDTGIGILQRDLPRIWDRLFRSDQSRTQKGLGLGLSLVQAIIQAHKGHIEVSSTPGKGSTFTFYWPADHRDTFKPTQ